MYKIMILRRAGATEPLWTVYKVEEEIDGVTSIIDFSTDSKEVLEQKIVDLLVTIPKGNIKPIEDLEFMLDVIIA